MRLTTVLLGVFAASLFASPPKTPAALGSGNVGVATTAASLPATTVNTELQSAKPDIDWYTDPIAIALALIALFVVVDLAIMVAHNAHHRPVAQWRVRTDVGERSR